MVVLTLAVLLSAAPDRAASAGATITVNANVVSTTTLTNGCTAPAGFQFGSVQPGVNLTTSTAPGACRFSFGSSNDTASLRIAQRDGAGDAMGRSSTSWVQSQDSTNIVNDAVALTTTAGYTVGPAGRLQQTLDGGSTWTTFSSATTGTTDWLVRAAVEAGSSTTFYTSGGNNNLLRVTNATSVTPTFTNYTNVLGFPAGSSVWGIYAPAVNVVFVVATSGNVVYVAKSINGGAAFSAPIVVPGATRAMDISGSSATDFWIVGSGATSGIFHTTTGGATPGDWTELGGGAPNRYWLGISMESTNNGYLLAPDGGIWRWNGTTLSLVPTTTRLTLRAIATAPGSPLVVWAAGSNGEAFRSVDGGATWARVESGTSAYLFAVDTVDGVHAILGGDDRWAGWSNDGSTLNGSTKYVASNSMADVASNPMTGQQLIAVGGSGLIRRSTDMGASWSTIASSTTKSLFAVDFVTSTTVWAVGDGGTILRSTDGGATWASQTSGVTGRLHSIDAVDELHAWAVGDAGAILHTVNGGTTWTTSASGTTHELLDVAAWSDSTVIVSGRGESVLRTSDSGASWTAATTPANFDTAVLSIEYATATTLFAANNYQKVWRSTDGGANWALTTGTPSAQDVTSLHVLDAQTIVVGGGYQNIKVSLDGGATWTNRPVSMDQVLGFTIVDGNTIIAVGRVGGQASTVASILANETVSQYAGSPANWAGGVANSMFGVCLQTLGGSATVGAGWTVDGGTCTTSDSDPWKAVPTTSTVIASVPSGTTGSADLVWGVRFGSAQKPGPYTAAVAFEVLAPG